MSARKLETEFTREFIKSFAHIFPDNGYIEKIPDHVRAPVKQFCKKCANLVMGMIRFTPVKPFDIFGWINGNAFALELKVFKSANNRWPMSSVTDNQLNKLSAANRAGGDSFVVIFIEANRNAAILRVEEYVRQQSLGRKSFTVDDLMMWRVIRRQKLPNKYGKERRVWDVRFLG